MSNVIILLYSVGSWWSANGQIMEMLKSWEQRSAEVEYEPEP